MTEASNVHNLYQFDTKYAVALSSLLWRTAYQLTRIIFWSKSPEYCSRIVTLIHACVVAFIGMNQCFLIDLPFNHPEWRTTYMQSFLLVFSLGYFIHDFIWCLISQTETKLMIAHHFYSICALSAMLLKGYSGAQATCALGGFEVTNPFLQARWLIRSEGLYQSILYFSVETTFLLLFVFIRIILGSYFMVVIVTHPKNDWDFIVLSFAIYIMSWMFLVHMIQYALVKYKFGNKLSNIENKRT